MAEKDIQKAVKEYLISQGWIVIKFHNGGFWTKDRKRFIPPAKKGVSDLLCCTPTGKFVALEIKTPKGSLSPDQRKFLNQVRKCKGRAYVIRSVEAAKRLVDRLKMY